jgi:hypothetical protein
MKVALLQDFFEHEIIGGAEKNDSVLLDYLSSQNKIKVKGIHTYDVEDVVDEYDFFVVSNFIRLPELVKQYLMHKKNYLIYEHDHKYIANRNPGAFKDFIAPKNMIINRDFYNAAKKVFVLSNVCKHVIEANLQISNVHSIGCSLWSESDLDMIRQINHTSGKTQEYGVLESNNTIKGTSEAIQFCSKNNIQPTLVSSPDYVEFLTRLSLCKKFIFFPQVLETFSRVCAEAKMLNCQVMTTPKLVGFFSEDYSSLSGNELNDKISDNIDIALQKFKEVIYE